VISAIVLAAGAATRFGRTKQVERLRGKPLAQHAVDAAAGAGVDEIIVVLGHDAELVSSTIHLPGAARAVVNRDHSNGMAGSLALGLRALNDRSDAAVVLLADQPGIRSDHVVALVRLYGDTGAPIVRIRFRDAPGPALFARSVWPEVEALTGDTGARVLLDAQPERVSWVALDEDAPRDVDVPEDLDKA
jgi:molybdenum cofactor cytidylyltransferase